MVKNAIENSLNYKSLNLKFWYSFSCKKIMRIIISKKQNEKFIN